MTRIANMKQPKKAKVNRIFVYPRFGSVYRKAGASAKKCPGCGAEVGDAEGVFCSPCLRNLRP